MRMDTMLLQILVHRRYQTAYKIIGLFMIGNVETSPYYASSYDEQNFYGNI